jgi:hypothetical protein
MSIYFFAQNVLMEQIAKKIVVVIITNVINTFFDDRHNIPDVKCSDSSGESDTNLVDDRHKISDVKCSDSSGESDDICDGYVVIDYREVTKAEVTNAEDTETENGAFVNGVPDDDVAFVGAFVNGVPSDNDMTSVDDFCEGGNGSFDLRCWGPTKKVLSEINPRFCLETVKY